MLDILLMCAIACLGIAIIAIMEWERIEQDKRVRQMARQYKRTKAFYREKKEQEVYHWLSK